MAFGFIKKVFSFGKKPADEAVPEESVQAPAIDTPAVDEAAAGHGPLPDFLRPAEADDASPQAPPAETETAASEVKTPEPEPEPVQTPPAEPERGEQEASAVAEAPAATEIPEAETVSPPAEEAAAAPAPVERPQDENRNQEESPAAPETASAGASPKQPAPAAELHEAAPAAEISPPLRQPDPIEAEPLRDEIAPEPAPVPPPPPPSAAGKVTVAKKVAQKAEPIAPAPQASRQSWFQRLKSGLARSSKELGDNISGVFTKSRLNEDIVDDLEEVLIRADLGMETAMRITDTLMSGRYGRQTTEADVRRIMADEVEKVLAPVAMPLELDLSHKPHVILVVGVNGTGKTTTIGKLAAKLTEGGLSVMLAAGDTFRAAAIEQLKIWGERTNSPVVASKLGADAAGLAWDAFEKARQAGSDVLIIDTAGRLQNKAELMAELEKIVRVLNRHDAQAPHTVLQTVDATTGQNAMNQVEIFRNVAGVNGLVMTKLDGTARGGILVAIAAKHKLPVYFIGVGEQVDDLEPFSASDFAKAIAGVA
ncbi:signal recognition particle-docking protein FtsY [Pseudaminobacter sp. NGMCC 1.201702]|uniref:signal recognition particle-docking protein FtsY n=1 Tax=Pseudaminobacter sp. NGMCC 1.201702 TaxID=3391825 RepID=UPI0039EFAADE